MITLTKDGRHVLGLSHGACYAEVAAAIRGTGVPASEEELRRIKRFCEALNLEIRQRTEALIEERPTDGPPKRGHDLMAQHLGQVTSRGG